MISIIYKIYKASCFHGIVIAISLSLFFSCKKFSDVDPPVTRANGENVYKSEATAIAVLTGMYSNIMRGTPILNFASGVNSFSLLTGLSGDEYTLFGTANANLSAFFKNALFVNNTAAYGADYWTVLYDYVYYANSAIEGLKNSSQGLTESVRNQLMGEAKFMRAFFYFYLVNLYGDVPLVTSVDYSVNAKLRRSDKSDVYKHIIEDLLEAQTLLSTEYLDGNLQKYLASSERIRPTKWAASALLARTYLFNNDWSNAEATASAVIGNMALFDTVSINNVFLKNSQEAIWQLQPVTTGRNTDDARVFVIPSSGFSNNNPVRLSNFLLNSFEMGDQRRTNGNWVKSITLSGTTYYFPFKYKINATNSAVTSPDAMTEYLMVLRLGEQYLIRAEARARQNNLSSAKSDLNVIRTRAGLPQETTSDKDALIAAILHERQLELFSEWGHRWLDLKRTGTVDAVMAIVTPVKANGAAWQSFQQYYPIPFNDVLRSQNLAQTPGY